MIFISFANFVAVCCAGNMAGIINMGAILEDLYQTPGNLTYCAKNGLFRR